MKKTLFIFSGLILTVNLFAQNCKLSPEANKYKIRAERAMNTITSDDDYKIAAEEFEKALQYAPKCGDILFNLALIYRQIGTKEGNFYFEKAEKYLNSYLSLNPNDKEAERLSVEIELDREKYQRKATKGVQNQMKDLEKYVGKWQGMLVCKKVASGETVEFNSLPMIEIIGSDGKLKAIVPYRFNEYGETLEYRTISIQANDEYISISYYNYNNFEHNYNLQLVSPFRMEGTCGDCVSRIGGPFRGISFYFERQ